jgi:hypothetical protein
LKLHHYLFLDYSAHIASEIVNKHNMELNLKNDKMFIDGVYKLARDMLGYVPKLTRDQFFQTGFVQIKALMAVDIIEMVQQKLKSMHHAISSSSSALLGNTGSTNNVLSVKTPSSHDINEHLTNQVHQQTYSPRHQVVNRQPVFNSYSSLPRQASLKVFLMFYLQSIFSSY